MEKNKTVTLIKKIFCFSVLLTIFYFSGCSQHDYFSNNFFFDGNYVLNRTEHFEKLNFSEEDDALEKKIPELKGEYTVLVISDVHFGSKKADFNPSDFFNWLDSRKSENKLPAFCLCLGDIFDHGNKSESELFCKFVEKVEGYGIKVFNTVGNHDLYNKGWKIWKEACYPGTSFYKFKTSNISWYGLDTGTGNLGPKQLSTLAKDFSGDTNSKIVFTHYPIFSNAFIFSLSDTTERNELITLLDTNDTMLTLGGHTHLFEVEAAGSFEQIVLPSFLYNNAWVLLHVTDTEEKTEVSYSYLRGNSEEDYF